MSHWRDHRSTRVSLYDNVDGAGVRLPAYKSSDIYEHGVRIPSSYKNTEIYEHDNEQAMNSLEDRVNILKRLTTDIHEEVGFHNRMLDGMGKEMDSTRGVISGTMARFKRVFETKSGRKMVTLVAAFTVIGLIVYFLIR